MIWDQRLICSLTNIDCIYSKNDDHIHIPNEKSEQIFYIFQIKAEEI